jgi:catechol 2,3-dioxygenase-like lactoylglutathione lyase family enzyme
VSTSIHHTRFMVSDLGRSGAFHAEHLGLEVLAPHERRGG